VPFFVLDHLVYREGTRIFKDSKYIGEIYAMILAIGCRLIWIPFVIHDLIYAHMYAHVKRDITSAKQCSAACWINLLIRCFFFPVFQRTFAYFSIYAGNH
jgi:hypothetical protein